MNIVWFVLKLQNNLDSSKKLYYTVTRIVDKLIQKGLVERKLCNNDRRKMDIVITDDGIEILKKLDKKVQAFHKPMMKNLTPEEAETLKQLIKRRVK